MAEFKCPKCGNIFSGIACRPCKAAVKGYICSECGERISNPSWAGAVHQWLRSDMVNNRRGKGAFVVEAFVVEAEADVKVSQV